MVGRARRRHASSPVDEFHSDHYLRHNSRVLEHLTSLGLPLAGRSVLEVGAGIGDHTSFFLDRGCTVVTSDVRPENCAQLRTRYPGIDARLLDLDDPDPSFEPQAEIVYFYGTLYHLTQPEAAISFLAARCTDLMLVQTCVSFGADDLLHPVDEAKELASQSVRGRGCRPTRTWVHRRLGNHFPYVYVPRTQPWHPEFPLDWTSPSAATSGLNARSIWVASRRQLDNPLLTRELLTHQAH